MATLGKGKAGMRFGSSLTAKMNIAEGSIIRGDWSMVCIDSLAIGNRMPEYRRLILEKGRDYALDFADQCNALKWVESWQNLITNVGRDYLGDAGLSGGTPITSWFVGLVNGATPTFALADTMASHAGWTEDQNYDEATRVAWAEAGFTGGQATNSASPATFTMNATTTIGGAFLVSDNTKGGTAGTLYAEGDLNQDRSVIDNDVLDVTATMTVADDGV